jgi:hypothetical protein
MVTLILRYGACRYKPASPLMLFANPPRVKFEQVANVACT